MKSDLCLRYCFRCFIFILCFNRQKTVLYQLFFFPTRQSTMPRRKSKRATTYLQRPNALSSLDIFTMMSYQRFQALCAISVSRSRRMLMLSMILEEDDDDLLLHLYRRHLFMLRNNT